MRQKHVGQDVELSNLNSFLNRLAGLIAFLALAVYFSPDAVAATTHAVGEVWESLAFGSSFVIGGVLVIAIAIWGLEG